MGAHYTVMVKEFNHIRDEATANAAITPGHFIELMSTGNVRVHATAGGNVAPKLVAIEDELQGNDLNDAYAANALCQYATCSRGDWVNAILADGQTATIGGLAESAGDGTVNVYAADVHDSDTGGTIYPENVIGVFREALDLSDSSLADPASARVLIEIV